MSHMPMAFEDHNPIQHCTFEGIVALFEQLDNLVVSSNTTTVLVLQDLEFIWIEMSGALIDGRELHSGSTNFVTKSAFKIL